MKIGIKRVNDKIATLTDYNDIRDKKEIAHIICELEIIKNELLGLWEDFSMAEEME